VTAAERQVLDLVAHRGACRVAELADATDLSSAEVLDALIELEGGGPSGRLRFQGHGRWAGGG
jgi:DNA-binding IclR family transcriptional regulator